MSDTFTLTDEQVEIISNAIQKIADEISKIIEAIQELVVQTYKALREFLVSIGWNEPDVPLTNWQKAKAFLMRMDSLPSRAYWWIRSKICGKE